MRYKFCPECEAKLTVKNAGDDGNVPFCTVCGRYWFDTFASCVIILVANEQGKIALLKQKYLSDKYETFVSGFIKPGETAEETAMREVYEEIGITLKRLVYAGTYWFGSREQLMHGFIGFTDEKNFKLSVEVDAAEWVSVSGAPQRMFPETPENTQYPLLRKYVELTKYNYNIT